VLAGTVSAAGFLWLLASLGAGAGLAVCRASTALAPAPAFGVGTVVVWSLLAIIALSLGGWVAGRCAGGRRIGWLHGLLAWSLTLLLVLPGVTLGWGRAFHRPVTHPAPSSGLSYHTVVRAERDVARTITERNQAELRSFVEEAVQSIPTNSTPKAATRAQREVGFAVTKLFAPGNAAGYQTNRDDVINALIVYTEMPVADANSTVDGWVLSHRNLRAELAKLSVAANQLRTDWTNIKVAEAADAGDLAGQRTHDLARLARWSFMALLIGLFGAALGGRCGAECASRNAQSDCGPEQPV
jgi:hypothetical protein